MSGGQGNCWPWTAAISKWGYGHAAFPRAKARALGIRHMRNAQRIAWELTNGEIPPGLCVLHSCDNPPCCNPSHLFLGTQADNQRDRARKGRSAQKLTREQVLAIRAECANESYASIARRYGIAQPNVWKIAHRKTWAHLP